MRRRLKYLLLISMALILAVCLRETDVKASDELSGHFYKVSLKTEYDSDSIKPRTSQAYWIFGNNGQVFITSDKKLTEYLLKNKNLIADFIESQNNYREKESHNYTINGDQLNVSTNSGTVLANTSVGKNLQIRKTVNSEDSYKEVLTFKEVK